MYETVNPAAVILGNLFSGACLGAGLYLAFYFLLRSLLGIVDGKLVLIIAGLILILMFVFGFGEFLQNLMYGENYSTGIKGLFEKFMIFVTTGTLLLGTGIGFYGSYKIIN